MEQVAVPARFPSSPLAIARRRPIGRPRPVEMYASTGMFVNFAAGSGRPVARMLKRLGKNAPAPQLSQHSRWSAPAILRLGLLSLPLIAGCGRTERPAPSAPRPLAGPSPRETQQCYVDLNRLGVRFSPLADHDYGAGCALVGTVQLVDIGVPVTNLGPVRCGQARAFAGWVRNAVAPAAYQMLGSELARVDSFGSYACRNVIGTRGGGDRRSGHAIANAIDVGGFVLKDGRRITILGDWRSTDPATAGFLRAVHASACRRFGTVLSPDYNEAHRNHLHLEDDRASFCR